MVRVLRSGVERLKWRHNICIKQRWKSLPIVFSWRKDLRKKRSGRRKEDERERTERKQRATDRGVNTICIAWASFTSAYAYSAPVRPCSESTSRVKCRHSIVISNIGAWSVALFQLRLAHLYRFYHHTRSILTTPSRPFKVAHKSDVNPTKNLDSWYYHIPSLILRFWTAERTLHPLSVPKRPVWPRFLKASSLNY